MKEAVSSLRRIVLALRLLVLLRVVETPRKPGDRESRACELRAYLVSLRHLNDAVGDDGVAHD